MHNRLRTNTASYLRTNLLIDYRKGERYFAETLVDWDLSNNTQGSHTLVGYDQGRPMSYHVMHDHGETEGLKTT